MEWTGDRREQASRPLGFGNLFSLRDDCDGPWNVGLNEEYTMGELVPMPNAESKAHAEISRIMAAVYENMTLEDLIAHLVNNMKLYSFNPRYMLKMYRRWRRVQRYRR